jgi:hypothetical protein
MVTPETLRKVADVAEKYKVQAVKVTSAARIALIGIKQEDVDAIWADLGMDVGNVVGICFIIAPPGDGGNDSALLYATGPLAAAGNQPLFRPCDYSLDRGTRIHSVRIPSSLAPWPPTPT